MKNHQAIVSFKVPLRAFLEMKRLEMEKGLHHRELVLEALDNQYGLNLSEMR